MPIPASSGMFRSERRPGKFLNLLNPSPSSAANINAQSLRRSASFSPNNIQKHPTNTSRETIVMASMVASKRIPLVRAMEKLLAASSAPGAGYVLRPVAVAGLRGYNSGAPLRRYEREETDEDSRRGARDVAVPPSFFSDVFRDPFSAPQSLGRLLSLMEDVASPVSRAAAPLRRGWNAKEDEEALHLRVDMPGLGKEHVKVWAEQNSLVIKGEGEKEAGEEEGAAAPRYSGRIELAGDVYRMDQIKAEMKNGVLRVVVPKVKEEQRRDVFQVNVD